jgi:hypothetical protein
LTSQSSIVNTAESYPLNQSGASSCKDNSSAGFKVFTGYQGISTPGDENQLSNAVAAYGPVVWAVDASAPELQLYGGGVFSSAALVIVGYGAGSEGAFWIAQNTLGEEWCEKGYIRILRWSNICGIATERVSPIVK